MKNCLIKHHVSYDSEEIMFVHFSCHRKIHDPENPLTEFIRYTPQERFEFYNAKSRIPATREQGNHYAISV